MKVTEDLPSLDEPAFTLGEFGKSLLIPSAFLIPSAALAVFFGIIQSNYGTNMGPYPQLLMYTSAPNEAAAALLIFSILTFVSGVILAIRIYSRRHSGIFKFYDDHIVWIKRGGEESLKYSDLEDAYFGDSLYRNDVKQGITPDGTERYVGGISFKVNGLSVRLSVLNAPEAASYIEERVPDDNIM